MADNLIPFPTEARNLTCRCGSVWFTTRVVFDELTREVAGYSLTHAVCSECGSPADFRRPAR